MTTPREEETRKCSAFCEEFETSNDLISCAKHSFGETLTPTLQQPEDWKVQFDKKFPSVESFSQRNGDYTEAPIPSIKAFISQELSLERKRVAEEISREITNELGGLREEARIGEGWTQDGDKMMERIERLRVALTEKIKEKFL